MSFLHAHLDSWCNSLTKFRTNPYNNVGGVENAGPIFLSSIYTLKQNVIYTEKGSDASSCRPSNAEVLTLYQYTTILNETCIPSRYILIKKVLHACTIFTFPPKFCKLPGKLIMCIDKILVMTADRNSDKRFIILLFLLPQLRD